MTAPSRSAASAASDDASGSAASLVPLQALRGGPWQRLLDRLLRDMVAGSIEIVLPDKRRRVGRGPAPGPHACVVLHRWRTVTRMALAGDIGLAESYRDGDWSTPDLAALLEFGIRNEAGWDGTLDAARPMRWLLRALHLARANTRRGSRQNIAFHYDLGNAFYARWLDPAMIYSSALYSNAAQSLEAAQQAKLDRVAQLLRLDELPAGAEVLEIGCGWGALALDLARRHGARVTGLTLSKEQLAHARARVEAEGASDRIDLRLQDYRDIGGSFDRIVSIEMMEAVGEHYWPTYIQTLSDRLRPGGVAVIQVITIAEAHFDKYRRSADFIQRFIFPGGMLPSTQAMHAAAERAGLTLRTAELFGESYARTLRDWRGRFVQSWPQIAALGFDDAFRRLWEYYLCYCEAGFRAGRVDVGLYTIERSAR